MDAPAKKRRKASAMSESPVEELFRLCAENSGTKVRPIPVVDNIASVAATIEGMVRDRGLGSRAAQTVFLYETVKAQASTVAKSVCQKEVDAFFSAVRAKLLALCATVPGPDEDPLLFRYPVVDDAALKSLDQWPWPSSEADLLASRWHKPLAGMLEPTNPGQGGYDVNEIDCTSGAIEFDITRYRTPVVNVVLKDVAGAVMLNTRVKAPKKSSGAEANDLHRCCDGIAAHRRMDVLCPPARWQFGPLGGPRTGIADPRYYLITGRHGFTSVHIDSGIQVVLYHVLRGVNKFISVPRAIAAILFAMAEFRGPDLSKAMEIELEVLRRLLELGKLEYAEVKAGESLLILPAAGHTVLTGNFKIVLAGEWHARSENDDLGKIMNWRHNM